MAHFSEVSFGRNTADLVGRARGGEIVIVELKNGLEEFKRAFNQLAGYRGYAHRVYIACTPPILRERAVAGSRTRSGRTPLPAACRAGLPVFSADLLQYVDVHRLLGHDLL
ncbi:MAG: MmcB family DNA repair protein [Terriglobia bacterium]